MRPWMRDVLAATAITAITLAAVIGIFALYFGVI